MGPAFKNLRQPGMHLVMTFESPSMPARFGVKPCEPTTRMLVKGDTRHLTRPARRDRLRQIALRSCDEMGDVR
jgi:hypothetical protein